MIIHPLGTLNSYRDIILTIKNINLMVQLEEKSGEGECLYKSYKSYC